MYLRPSGHIYRRDFNTLSVALATGYRSARSAPRLGSRRGMVPVRSARTPQFEERVYQWSRRHRKGSACGCGFRQGRRAVRWAPPSGAGWRSGFPRVPRLTATSDVCGCRPGGRRSQAGAPPSLLGYVPRRGPPRTVWVIAAAALRAAVPTGGRRSLACASPLPAGVRAETGVIRELGDTWFARLPAGGAGPHREDCPEVGVPLPARRPCPRGYVPKRASYGNWAIRGSPAFRRAVPGPTGRTAQRSAFPCLRAALARRGTCRDGRHTGTGRYVVRPPFGGRCRAPPGGLPGGRGFLAGVLSERAAVRGLVVGTNRVQRKNPGAGWPRGSSLIQIRRISGDADPYSAEHLMKLA